jgi:hypothetical protein
MKKIDINNNEITFKNKDINSLKDKFNKSDSLMNESRNKKYFARTNEKIAKAQIKMGNGDKVRLLDLKGTTTPTAKERLYIAKKLRVSAEKDSINSIKFKRIGK